MATKMAPGDFNPLDMLAAAASLQTQVPEGEEQTSDSSSKSDTPTVEDKSEEGEESSAGINDNSTVSKATSVYKIHVKRSSTEDAPNNNNSIVTTRSINPGSSCIVKVVAKKASGERVVETLQPQMSLAGQDCNGKRKLAVLQITKQGPDHSYCSAGPLDRSRSEEDEGYASRSSMDSPGQWKSDSECEQSERTPTRLGSVTSPIAIKSPVMTQSMDVASPQSVDSETSESVRSPSLLAPVFSPPQSADSKKPTKIVIMSSSATDVQKWITTEPKGMASSLSGQNVTLRSLLGQSRRLPAGAKAQAFKVQDGDSAVRKAVLSPVGTCVVAPDCPDNTLCVLSTQQATEAQSEEQMVTKLCDGCDIEQHASDEDGPVSSAGSCGPATEHDDSTDPSVDSSADMCTVGQSLPRVEQDEGGQALAPSVDLQQCNGKADSPVKVGQPPVSPQTVSANTGPGRLQVASASPLQVQSGMKYMIAGTDSQDKMVLLPLARNKYIIEDDIPPVGSISKQPRHQPTQAGQTPSKNPTVAVPTSLVAVPSLQSGQMGRSPPASSLGEQVVSVQRGVPGPISIVQQYGSTLGKAKPPCPAGAPLKVTAVGSATQTKAAIIPAAASASASSKVLARSQSSAITLVEKKVTTAGVPRTTAPSVGEGRTGSSGCSHSSSAPSVSCSVDGSTDVSSKETDSVTSMCSSQQAKDRTTDTEPALVSTVADSTDAELEGYTDLCPADMESDQNLMPPVSSPSLGTGRLTPLEAVDSSPGEKINIKISGSKVIDISGASDPSVTSRKATTSIGTVGSLSSWTSLGSLASRVTPDGGTAILSTGGPSPNLFVLPTTASGPKASKTPLRSHSDSALSALVNKLTQRTQHQRRKITDDVDESEVGEMSARTCHSYIRKKNRASALLAQSMLDLTRMRQSAQLISRLHPIIDHDYCTFAEFSAEIQSSIIATTETKLKNERKYAKKAKAARTKAVRGIAPTDKTGRVKRKYVRRKLLASRRSNDSAAATGAAGTKKPTPRTSLASNPGSPARDISKEVEAEIGTDAIQQLREKRKYVRGGNKKVKVRSARLLEQNDKNYVKITGSYQDEFVYFTTKKTRGRPRKAPEPADTAQAPTKIQAVGGLSVFDWYRDLSKADKSSRFGVSGMGTPRAEADTAGAEAQQLGVPTASLGDSGSGSTPLHDSDVVDLVMDMMPPENLGVDSTENKIFDGTLALMAEGSDKVEEEVVVSTDPEGVADVEHKGLVSDSNVSLADVADQIRNLLSSMDDQGLKRLMEDLGKQDAVTPASSEGDQAAGTPETSESTALKEEVPPSRHDADTSLNSLNVLLPYSQEEPGMQTTPNHQLHDLEDINDSDLIQSDLSGMNTIFSDFKSSTTTSMTWTDAKVSQSSFSDVSSSPMKQYLDTDLASGSTSEPASLGVFGNPLDKTELFPDMTTPSVSTSAAIQDSAVPELTVVSMYWNDLPGLIISGRQYVRLVDIHKQVLPAKDTGILKKRCQMMGLDIMNCTELQRDFLIRYANAAKSKSTVVAPKEAAETLIGFYVDPRPRAAKQSSQGDSKEGEARAEAAVTEGVAVKREKATKAEPAELSNEKQTGKVPEELCSLEEKQEAQMETENKEDQTASVSEERDLEKARLLSSSSSPCSKAKSSPTPRKKKAVTLPLAKDASENLVHLSAEPGVVPVHLPAQDVKRSDRLRNRRVQYAAMVHGTFEGARDGMSKYSRPSFRPRECANDSNSENNEDSTCEGKTTPFPEEGEIRALRSYQKKRPLNKREKKRLKKLREKLRIKASSRRPLLKKLSKPKLGKQDRVVKLKAKQRRLKEKQVNGSKYEQEHCYAAHPSPEAVAGRKQPPENSRAVDEKVVHLEAVEVPSGHDPSLAPCKELGSPEFEARRKVGVLHRNGHRSRGQEGRLSLHRFKTREAACIECSTCQELFSVRRFLKHMHMQNNPDELVEVSLHHKLEILSRCPTDEENATWWEFLERRTGFEQQASAGRRASKSMKQDSLDSSLKSARADTDVASEENSLKRRAIGNEGREAMEHQEVPGASGTLGEAAKTMSESAPDHKSLFHAIGSCSSLDSVEDFQKLSSDVSPVTGTASSDSVEQKSGHCGTSSSKQGTSPSPFGTESPRHRKPVGRPRRGTVSPKPTEVEMPACGTRHSTRVRKRKQLHPMESYVFSGTNTSGDGVPPKRTRHESGLMRQDARLRDRCT